RVGMDAAAHIAALRPAGRVDVSATKSSATDAVTDIDRASEEFIRDRLVAARPDDTIIGEEGEDRAGTSSVSWLVDPIDGTVNFVYGIPAYAVSLAAVQDGDVVAGFVVNVVSCEAWGAALGYGALHWQPGQEMPSLLTATPPPVAGLAHALVATGFNYVPNVRARQAAAVAQLMPHVRDIRRFGSAALDLCALASGRFDAYVEQGLQPWDLAAGALICREAGLTVSGLDDDGRPGPPGERLVIAAHPSLFREFFSLVRACGF
ncbi:MAG TPA: inositol monophosphatase family protein, partial [Aeromicrobium sp.]|nr:inositol monophosphatase family protein [Aeromicrobium sp.]